MWTSFLATYGPLDWSTVPLEEAGLVHVSVGIRGDWTGTLTVEMAPSTAETAARTTLGLDTVEDADVAPGELVNEIGGNIESLLSSDSTLGLPIVSTHPFPSPHRCGHRALPGRADLGGHAHPHPRVVGRDLSQQRNA